MMTIAITNRQTAVRSQRETTRGDVHIELTKTPSSSPHNTMWTTEEALQCAAEQGMSPTDMWTLFHATLPPRDNRAEYPIRGYYIALAQYNLAQQDAGNTNRDTYWRWRSFNPTPHTFVEGICRWDGARWITMSGERMFEEIHHANPC